MRCEAAAHETDCWRSRSPLGASACIGKREVSAAIGEGNNASSRDEVGNADVFYIGSAAKNDSEEMPTVAREHSANPERKYEGEWRLSEERAGMTNNDQKHECDSKFGYCALEGMKRGIDECCFYRAFLVDTASDPIGAPTFERLMGDRGANILHPCHDRCHD